MLHDLIPNDHPEYAQQKEAARHLRRLQTVSRFADGILVPSEAVRQSVLMHLEQAGRSHVPVRKVLHGVDPELVRVTPANHASWPYFVCLGTIEPRKNHLLLLNIWRRLVETHGDNAPRLVLIGRRGWENENVIDMIERCKALQGVVQEYSSMPDEQVRALLMRSSRIVISLLCRRLRPAANRSNGTGGFGLSVPTFRCSEKSAATILNFWIQLTA